MAVVFWAFFGVSIAELVLSGNASGLFLFGFQALFFGAIAVFFTALLLAPFYRRTANSTLQRTERLDRAVRVDVDDLGLRTDAREDEDWDGAASRDEIEGVYAQPWHGGVTRVRVALHSGHHYTLVDGLFDEHEAGEVARAIEERLG